MNDIERIMDEFEKYANDESGMIAKVGDVASFELDEVKEWLRSALIRIRTATLEEVVGVIAKLEGDIHGSEADGEYANGIAAGFAVARKELENLKGKDASHD